MSSDDTGASITPRVDEMPWVLPFDAIGADDLPRVGGKGANLGELTRVGLPVPPGFCVTTRAWAAHVADHPEFEAALDRLDALDPDDLDGVRALGASIRGLLVERAMPPAVRAAVLAAWRAVGSELPYAVRSSATAEDLPTASFAGQQDTYLNVVGEADLIERVRACWASLYTDRAILYRMRNRVPHRQVALSVVVQRLVRPDKSGILFTADPISGHRGHTSIDAGFGLGEALVSGLVDADLYVIESASGRMVTKTIGDKALAIEWVDGGGTRTVDLPPEKRRMRVLGDAEVARLVALGQRIEAHYGRPQDIEWCFAGTELFVVQARPITSLYPQPAPKTPGEGAKVYACFNHFQVMTDAVPPMGLDVWRRMMPFGRAAGDEVPCPWAVPAGGRLYLDLAPILRRGPGRRALTKMLGFVDPLMRNGVVALVERPGFAEGVRFSRRRALGFVGPKLGNLLAGLAWRDPARWREAIVAGVEAWVVEQQTRLSRAEQPAQVVAAVSHTLAGAMVYLLERLVPLIACGLVSSGLLRRCMGPAHAADVEALARGLLGNVTTDMDLAVGDLADVARGEPAVVEALRAGVHDRAALAEVPGGAAFVAALNAFLERYGARAPSEIDISRPRWRERPGSVIQAVVGNLSHGEAGAHRAHHARLTAEADAAGERLVAAAGRGLLGPLRRWWVRRLVRRQRVLAALREHPKFAIVRVFDGVRRALLRLGERLVREGRLDAAADVWLLDLAALSDPGDLRARVADARAVFEHDRTLSPPRLMSEHGEIPPSRLAVDAPEGVLVGSPASSGVVEGIVRVVRDPHAETVHKGEILVAPFTDPGWTPLFINAAGLVMEVGGRMTHGSVVAREYGLPAVVGLPGATEALRTGMRVRVDGERGWVEILDPSDTDDAAQGEGGV